MPRMWGGKPAMVVTFKRKRPAKYNSTRTAHTCCINMHAHLHTYIHSYEASKRKLQVYSIIGTYTSYIYIYIHIYTCVQTIARRLTATHICTMLARVLCVWVRCQSVTAELNHVCTGALRKFSRGCMYACMYRVCVCVCIYIYIMI